MDFKRNLAILAQTEMDTEVAGRRVPDAARDGGDLGALAATDDAGTDRGAIAFCPCQSCLQPVSCGAAVHPQFHGFVDRGDRRVDPAIVVKISECDAPVQASLGKISSDLVGYVRERPVLIPEDAIGLWLVDVESSIGNEEIEPAVVVQINQTAAPPIPCPTQVQQTAGGTGVVKCSIPAVVK